MIKPTYYQGQDNKDLFDRFESGLMPISTNGVLATSRVLRKLSTCRKPRLTDAS